MAPARRTRVRSAVPLTLAAGALVLAGTGGAVAGTMITGAQIKNNTITSADVRTGSLTAGDVAPATRTRFDAVQRYEHRRFQQNVASGASANPLVECSPGRHVLSASAFWGSSNEAVQVVVQEQSTSARAYGLNPGGTTDTLKVDVICAVVSGKTVVQVED